MNRSGKVVAWALGPGKGPQFNSPEKSRGQAVGQCAREGCDACVARLAMGATHVSHEVAPRETTLSRG